MRLIHNEYGKSPPLIMHPWLWFLRSAHINARFIVQAMLGRPRTLPSYCLLQMSPDQEARLYRACENFIGARGSSEPEKALRYKIRSIEGLLDSPTVSDERKEQLRTAKQRLESKLQEQPAPAASTRSATTNVTGVSTNGSEPLATEPQEELTHERRAASVRRASTRRSVTDT